MYELHLSAVPQWRATAGRWFPAAIDTYCPFCNRSVTFTPRGHVADVGRSHTISASADCPGCRETVHFWAVGTGKADDASQKECACLVMFPSPKLPRLPIEGLELIPDDIQQAYRDALEAHNASVWPGAATCSGRTLEGIMGSLRVLNRSDASHSEQPDITDEFTSVTETLRTLSNSVRRGRNLGAHFNIRKAPDQETSEAMLDLIEYVLDYIYILPARVAKLDDRLALLGKDTATT